MLGTRLAVFASMPRLGLIVVDEEHDPSYKQQEGARYSARDLAVYRGHLERRAGAARLGDAVARELAARQRRPLPAAGAAARIGGGALPAVRLFDMNLLPRARRGSALSPPLIAALQQRLARGEQSLVFLNRRGYAPVLHCAACGWKSGCPHCSAWRVFHKRDRTLRCHHCGFTERVPRACPDCGNLDIAPIGRGTERLEEQLARCWPAARAIARIDADSTRAKGALEAQLGAVHAGDVDVLVGTQMVDQGPRLPPHHAGGRGQPRQRAVQQRLPRARAAVRAADAGRPAAPAATPRRPRAARCGCRPGTRATRSTRRCAAHDFAAFAASQLKEREIAGLPPFSHLALLRAEARTPEAARGFLHAARRAARRRCPAPTRVMVYPPVPLAVARVADVERMQMLVESASRGRAAAPARALAAGAARAAPRQRGASCAGRSTSIRWRSEEGASGRLSGRPRDDP